MPRTSSSSLQHYTQSQPLSIQRSNVPSKPQNQSRKSQCYIKVLPEEIILRIIQIKLGDLVPYRCDGARTIWLFLVSQINRQWRHITLSHSHLWTHHYLCNLARGSKGLRDEYRFALALYRSGKQRLTLEVDLQSYPTARFYRAWRLFMRQCSRRVEKLSILGDIEEELEELGYPEIIKLREPYPDADNPWECMGVPHKYYKPRLSTIWDIFFPLIEPTPRLRELEVRGHEFDDTQFNFLSASNGRSRIDNLHLSLSVDFTILRESFDPSRLLRLQISPHINALNTIPPFLRECSNLQCLFFQQRGRGNIPDSHIYEGPDDPDIVLPGILLPSLVSLRLAGDGAFILGSAIHAPRLVTLEVLAELKRARSVVQFLRDTLPSRNFPTIQYLNFEVHDSHSTSESAHSSILAIASHLCPFLCAYFRTIQVVVMKRDLMLTHTLRYLVEASRTRKIDFFYSWRLLHIVSGYHDLSTLPSDLLLNLIANRRRYPTTGSQARPPLQIEFSHDGERDDHTLPSLDRPSQRNREHSLYSDPAEELNLNNSSYPYIRVLENGWEDVLGSTAQRDEFATEWISARIETGWKEAWEEMSSNDPEIKWRKNWGWWRPFRVLEELRKGMRT